VRGRGRTRHHQTADGELPAPLLLTPALLPPPNTVPRCHCVAMPQGAPTPLLCAGRLSWISGAWQQKPQKQPQARHTPCTHS
jgi:hypothetical protein